MSHVDGVVRTAPRWANIREPRLRPRPEPNPLDPFEMHQCARELRPPRKHRVAHCPDVLNIDGILVPDCAGTSSRERFAQNERLRFSRLGTRPFRQNQIYALFETQTLLGPRPLRPGLVSAPLPHFYEKFTAVRLWRLALTIATELSILQTVKVPANGRSPDSSWTVLGCSKACSKGTGFQSAWPMVPSIIGCPGF